MPLSERPQQRGDDGATFGGVAFVRAWEAIPEGVAPETWSTARHEAAHAVVARLAQVRHGHLQAAPVKTRRSHGPTISGYLRISKPMGARGCATSGAVALAPLVALHNYYAATGRPWPTPAGDDPLIAGCSSDSIRVVEELRRTYRDDGDRDVSSAISVTLAHRMLTCAWPAMFAVARAAATAPRHRLSAVEIGRLVRGSTNAWYGPEHARVRAWAWRALAPLKRLTARVD